MLSIRFGEINYWGVLVAAVATFILGAVWYTVLFGSQRKQLLGYTEGQLKQMEQAAPVTFTVLFLCYVLVAFVVAALFAGFNVHSAAQGAQLGVLFWLGFAAAIGLTGNVTTAIPLGVFLVDAGYQLVFLVMTGAIVGAWHK